METSVSLKYFVNGCRPMTVSNPKHKLNVNARNYEAEHEILSKTKNLVR